MTRRRSATQPWMGGYAGWVAVLGVGAWLLLNGFFHEADIGRLAIVADSDTVHGCKTAVRLQIHLMTIEWGDGSELWTERDLAGHRDLSAFERELATFRDQHPEAISVELDSDDSVPYEDFVQVVDACFGAGLSAATWPVQRAPFSRIKLLPVIAE